MASYGAPVIDLDEPEYAEGVRGPAPYPRDDEQDDAKYATYSRALLDEQTAAMEPLFLTWTQNLLFLAGLQWWRYDTVTGTFRPPSMPDWKERPVRNLLLPYFKNFLAKVTKNRPVTSAVPASTDPDDIQSAQLGNDVLKAKWLELRRSRVLRRAIAWVVPCGNAYIMPHWKQDSGLLQPLTTLVEAMRVDETGQPAIDEMGQPAVEMLECPCDEEGEPILDEQGNYDLEAEPAWVDIGEVGDKVLSPFQVFVDPGAECEEDVTFVLVAEPLTIREIHRRWPEATNVVAEDVSDIERFDHFITGLASGADTHLVASQTERDTQVPKGLVLHYFERKSEEFPEGRHWVSVGRECLESPGPLPDGTWPVIVHITDVEVPGRFHAEATLTAAVGLQREYNDVNAQIKEHHNLLLRGKWLVPIGSNIKRGQITTRPGEVIQHTPGLPPKMADLKPLPAAVYDERDRIRDDFELITGLHRISQGKPPPGVTSGRAFLTLQEADDSDFGPFLEMLEESVAQWAWLTLQIIQRYYEEDRLLRVSGENNRYRVRTFKGADLNAIVDVVPQQGSSFPWSAVAKQSMMIELAGALPQLFTDPETGMFDHERFRELLPVGGAEAVGIGSDLDVSEALREEEEFEHWDGEGPFPMVQPWQNHAIHLRQHGRILKSAAFLSWPPHAQDALLGHWMETQAQMRALQLQQLQQQAMLAGGDGGSVGLPGEEEPPPELTEADRDVQSG